MNKMNKRGLSQVVTTVILILVVLAAVVIIWAAVRPTLKSVGDQIGTAGFTISLEIISADVATNPGTATVVVKRNAGKGDLAGLNIILTDDAGNSEVFPDSTEINELETKSIDVDYSGGNLGTIVEVSVAPIFISAGGDEIIGNVIDTYEILSGGGAWWSWRMY